MTGDNLVFVAVWRTQVVALLLSTIALGAAIAPAQMADGEISGRIADKDGGAIPGARIRITSDGLTREAITDRDGRFTVRSLPLARHLVVAELTGFLPASGEVTLSPEIRRADLKWSLEVGCLADQVRVLFKPRDAARLADAIVHLRVVSADGPVLRSRRAGCEGYVRHEYSTEVLAGLPGRGGTGAIVGPRQIFMRPRELRLRPGAEYVALLWPEGVAEEHLLLPILSGRVTAAGELNGLTVAEALAVLDRWARERRQ